jgi:hypothetical protein
MAHALINNGLVYSTGANLPRKEYRRVWILIWTEASPFHSLPSPGFGPRKPFRSIIPSWYLAHSNPLQQQNKKSIYNAFASIPSFPIAVPQSCMMTVRQKEHRCKGLSLLLSMKLLGGILCKWLSGL